MLMLVCQVDTINILQILTWTSALALQHSV
jgi:hypothetical protein